MSGFNGYIQLVYVLVAAMFVVGLHLMNSPATARRGNQVAQAGMVIAHDGKIVHEGVAGLLHIEGDAGVDGTAD